MDKRTQRNLLLLTVICSMLVVWLFNLFWEPLIFMGYTSYIVMNKGRSLSLKERIGFVLVLCFMIYSMTARLYGRGPGLFVITPVMIISLIVVWKLFGGKK